MEPLDHCRAPDLRHLRRLTNDVGIWQHTRRETPDESRGYALDDVARALIAVLETERLFPKGERRMEHGEFQDRRTLDELATLYLAFIAYCHLPDGRFHNFVAADKAFHDQIGSEDAFGRTVWALGVVIHNSQLRTQHSELGARAVALFQGALPHVTASSPHLRSKAFTLLGLLAALGAPNSQLPTPNSQLVEAAAHLVSDLLHAHEDAAAEGWPWFEETLRYSNGVLPYALLGAAGNEKLKRQNAKLSEQARTVGLASLDFLLRTLPVDGVPAPVGNQWWPRGGERPLYDQQCVDTAATVVACAEAFRVTNDARYRDAAETWWRWFFGANTKGSSLYRPEDGAVYDGLTPHGVNENRGAESVLAFLLAHLSLADTLCPRSA